MRLPSPIPLTHSQTRMLRLRAQQLSPFSRAETSPKKVVRHALALQAQESAAAALSLRARAAPGLTAEQAARALDLEQSILRTWLLRGTLHWAAAEDAGWLLDLLGERTIQQLRGRHTQLGLTPPGLERAAGLLGAALEGGPRTRRELGEVLAGQGLPVAGQALIHTIAFAALRGVLCYGPERQGEETFRLLDLPKTGTPDKQAALLELARRYLECSAPAAPADLAAWAGIPLSPARQAFTTLEAELLPVLIAGEPAWMLARQAGWLDSLERQEDQPVVNLVPRYDTYLLSYRDRGLAVPAEFARRIHPGGGILHPAVLVDGVAAGTWRIESRRAQPRLEVTPFAGLSAQVGEGLAREAADIGQFLSHPLELVLLPPDSPL